MNAIKELRKPAKRRGATRMIISGFKQNIYFIDLIDFSSKQHKSIQEVLGRQKSTGFYMNSGYKYVLVCIDGYSKYLMTRKLKSKSATEVIHAMKDIIQTYGESPKHSCSDRGTEFTNAIFRTNILNKYDITIYHMDSANKAVLAERTIRDIKEDIMVPFNQSMERCIAWFSRGQLLGRSLRVHGTDVIGGRRPAQDLLQVNKLFLCLFAWLFVKISYSSTSLLKSSSWYQFPVAQSFPPLQQSQNPPTTHRTQASKSSLQPSVHHEVAGFASENRAFRSAATASCSSFQLPAPPNWTDPGLQVSSFTAQLSRWATNFRNGASFISTFDSYTSNHPFSIYRDRGTINSLVSLHGAKGQKRHRIGNPFRRFLLQIPQRRHISGEIVLNQCGCLSSQSIHIVAIEQRRERGSSLITEEVSLIIEVSLVASLFLMTLQLLLHQIADHNFRRNRVELEASARFGRIKDLLLDHSRQEIPKRFAPRDQLGVKLVYLKHANLNCWFIILNLHSSCILHLFQYPFTLPIIGM